MCRSESPVNREPSIISAWMDIVPAERHIGRSLRILNKVKPHIADEADEQLFIFQIIEILAFSRRILYNEKIPKLGEYALVYSPQNRLQNS